ncbi:MAG TPA: hypothetical protein VG364_06205 [Candidatus Dormibacteraeota bacterium]|jgi:hypothetical protein|nr:hypothetical protein [Candidatus Dormibacteraeota bacterium]
MIPMEPGPEDFARQLSERRAQMESARVLAYMAHSRRGLLARFLQRLADRLDPTGIARGDLR